MSDQIPPGNGRDLNLGDDADMAPPPPSEGEVPDTQYNNHNPSSEDIAGQNLDIPTISESLPSKDAMAASGCQSGRRLGDVIGIISQYQHEQ